MEVDSKPNILFVPLCVIFIFFVASAYSIIFEHPISATECVEGALFNAPLAYLLFWLIFHKTRFRFKKNSVETLNDGKITENYHFDSLDKVHYFFCGVYIDNSTKSKHVRGFITLLRPSDVKKLKKFFNDLYNNQSSD